MGYVVNTELEEQWDISKYDPVKAQNSFCHLLGVSGDLLVPIDSTKVDERHYTVSVNSDSYVFVYLGNNALSSVTLTKGETSRKFSQVSFDYLLDLGYAAKDTVLELEVVEEDEKFKTFKAYELNMRVLNEAIDILSAATLQIEEYGEKYLKGNVTLEEAGRLILSIPMEKGWTMYVNGVETPIESFKDAFMVVDLKTGTYEIELEFETPGFKEGLLISVACIAVFAVCRCVERRRQRRL